VPALAEALPCPVEQVSPLTITDGVAPREEHQASLAGAIGLAQRWAVAGTLPVNLAVPKRTQVAASPTRRRWLVYGVAAGLLLATCVGGMYWTISNKRGQVLRLTKQKDFLESELRSYAQDRADIDALKEWEAGTIPWLDELYDLTARFPYEQGFRINHFVVGAAPAAKKLGAKDKDKEVPAAAVVKLVGVNPPALDPMVQQLRDAIGRDGHLKATIENIKKGGAVHEFTIRVEVAKQSPSDYTTVLVVPPEALKNAALQAKNKKAPQAFEPGDDE
jgi:hypothetical protein